MASSSAAPIPAAEPGPREVFGENLVTRLCDRQHEKRKAAAMEIQERVRSAGIVDRDHVRKILQCLQKHFLEGQQSNPHSSNQKKGGLIGIASVAMGLGDDIDEFLPQLVRLVLQLFSDEEARVRYYACETFHNIAKVAKGKVLTFFVDIFAGLCKLYADVDTEVRAGVAVLDRLMKDIVERSPELVHAEKIVPVLKDRAKFRNPYVRQLVLAWITLLLNIRESVDIVQYLPEYLEDLFNMLGDQSRDIRHNAETTLDQLLKQLVEAENGLSESRLQIILESAKIVVKCCKSTDASIRMATLIWLNRFIKLQQTKVPVDASQPFPFHERWIELLPLLLEGTLHCFEDKEDGIARMAVENNNSLLEMARHVSSELPVDALIGQLKSSMRPSSRSRGCCVVRTDCLQWMCLLLSRSTDKALRMKMMDNFGNAIFETLKGQDDEVVAAALDVLALIMEGRRDKDEDVRDEEGRDFFDVVANRLLDLFKQQTLEEKGWLVIRHLCGHLDVRRLYTTVARAIQEAAAKNEQSELEFTQQLVQTFSWILFTATETKRLRDELLEPVPISGLFASPVTDEDQERPLFFELLLPWFHNPVSALALCLWAQQYDLATELTARIATLEPTLDLLKQLDQLVHLLESPIFSRVRLQLLEPRKHPALLKCVLGLAMLLPQAGAFNILRQRVQVVQSGLLLEAQSSHSSAPRPTKDSEAEHSAPVTEADLSALLERFDTVTAALSQPGEGAPPR
mmetsp:Transcript_108187/g.312659  ORF Transcript_108187/g.312659 Transcript_108187/m.312659 type:complete len:741 (-) Transcript_108187:145-2367(-)